MRTLITVKEIDGDYKLSIETPNSFAMQTYKGADKAENAAVAAAGAMAKYALGNPDGGEVMAPVEVMRLIPGICVRLTPNHKG